MAGDTRAAAERRGASPWASRWRREDLLAHARRKLEAKGLDLIVANDATAEGAGFDVETNRVTLLSADGEPEALPLQSKHEVAEVVLDRVSARLESGA